MEPILVIFDERKEKELVWTKLRDNLKTKTNVVVTQDSSSRRLEAGRKTSQSSPRNRVQLGRDQRSHKKMSLWHKSPKIL